MSEDTFKPSRRKVLKQSGLALSALTGTALASTSAAASYDHKIRVEADDNDGWFRVWMDEPDRKTTENTEGYDKFDQGGIRLESRVSNGRWAEGYDVFKWDGGTSSPDGLTINEYNHGISAYFDGELIERPDECGGGC